MNKLLITVLALVLLPVCSAQVWEDGFPETRDFGEDCNTARVIDALPFNLFFVNSDLEPGLPKGSCNSQFVDEMKNDVWFKYTATQELTLDIELDTSLYDSMMVLYIGPDCNNLTEVFCQNLPHPIITDLLVSAGETCWIQIGDYGSFAMGGNNTLNITGDASATPTPTATPTAAGPGDNCSVALTIGPGDCVVGTTDGMHDSYDCSVSGPGHWGPDVVYALEITEEAEYWILVEAEFNMDMGFATTCDSVTGDLQCEYVGLHYSPICTSFEPHPLGGYNSYNGILEPGTYYLWIDSNSSATGQYSVEIYQMPAPTPTYTPCATCPPGGTQEGEETCYYDYIDVYNGGCNIPDGSPTPGYNFQPVSPGEVICGTAGWFDTPDIGDSRDMDWYEIEIYDDTWLGMTLNASFDSTLWIFDSAVGCDDPTAMLHNTELVCDTNFMGLDVGPGTYWLVVGPEYSNHISWPCGSEYVMEVYAGPSPTPTPAPECMMTEGFEIAIPPAGWTTTTAGTGAHWRATDGHIFSGNGAIYCPYVAADHDEWLISPSYDLTQISDPTIRFAWITSFYWMVYPINNADIILNISTDDGTTWVPIWSDESLWHFLDWEWVETSVDLAAYANETSVQFAWQYIGNDGTNIYLDEIRICDSTGFSPPTPTPTTGPGTPTNTPTSTPTYTPTSTPTFTPSYTPTSTPTTGPGTPTYTPHPTNTPTFTPSHTHTPIPTNTPSSSCDTLGVDLILPGNDFGPGDTFYCHLNICNPSQTTYSNTPTFVLLEVFGAYFFAPSFSENLDMYTLSISPGLETLVVLPEFSWPAGAGSASGIFFHAAMTTVDMSALFGEMDSEMFSWHE